MTKMSVNEFRADPDRALAMLDLGAEVEVERDGELIARMTPTAFRRLRGEELARAREQMRRMLEKGIPLGGGPYSDDDKYGDAHL